jgi:hypothetical protein
VRAEVGVAHADVRVVHAQATADAELRRALETLLRAIGQ